MKPATCLSIRAGFVIGYPAFADCLAEQHEVHRLEAAALEDAQGKDLKSFMTESTCETFGPHIKAAKAKAAFIRHCYAELGMTQLQAEEAAHQEDMRAQAMSDGC